MTRSQTAQDAQIRVDNVDMQFASNDVTTAIPNLRINLNKAAPGSTVTLGSSQPTTTMKDLVKEYVSAYNSLKTALNEATASGANGSVAGALANDTGVRDMARSLAALTSTKLASSGAYQTLSDIGVKTNRDGTLSLDTAKLDAALEADAEAVTQMLNPTVASADNPGIAGALKSVADYLNKTDGPLASSAASYAKLKENLQDQLDALDTKMSNYQEQLTKVYSAMQSKLSTLQGIQSYVKQQVEVWNNSSS
jgi:flagellar hook-associated protein 2